MMYDWENLVDEFGWAVLADLGYAALPSHQNVVTENLGTGYFNHWQTLPGYSIVGLSRLATLNQMAVFDAQDGPEQDDKPKALRRHWYAWYKVNFALPFSKLLGEDHNDPSWGTRWAGRLSKTYAEFVDTGLVTYRDLWVDDASRMVERFWETISPNISILVCVEKDSLLEDFIPAARALGAKAVYSGKGKSSKAAIEKLLRNTFHWSDGYDPFSYEHPLYVLHVSDYDYDGEAVIGPTFGEQCRRYTPHVIEARVGIQPNQVTEAGYRIEDKWYQIKLSNQAYKDWAKEKALYKVASTIQRGIVPYQDVGQPAHGLEVEALYTSDYSALLASALLQVLDFDNLVRILREDCRANAREAAEILRDREVLSANQGYQELLAEIERLEDIRDQVQRDVSDTLYNWTRLHDGDFVGEGDDPAPEDYISHVRLARGYSSPWHPFSEQERTELLCRFVSSEYAEEIEELIRETEVTW